jgi:hypothetical protein
MAYAFLRISKLERTHPPSAESASVVATPMGHRDRCVEPEEQRAHAKGMKVHRCEVSVRDCTR